MQRALHFWGGLSGPAKTLGATVAFAYAGQIAVAAYSIPNQTEKYYDLAGSAGFLSCTALSIFFPYLRARYLGQAAQLPSFATMHPRQILMTGAITLWAGRLGTFLFQRIKKSGRDKRFDDIKKSPIQFAGAFAGQALWIALTAFPVYAVNALGKAGNAPLNVRDYVGFTVWVAAFLFEVTADRQKSAWREARDKKEHDEKFISSGLWAKSRHPNYVGEVSMWLGLAIASQAALTKPAAKAAFGAWAPWVAVASPLFEYLLIRYASGVPMLEEGADKRFGGDEKYEQYKRETPVFWPKL